MKLDLEDIGMCLNKSLDNNIHMVEKTTQTESFPMASPLELEGTPNGTTPCNHPSMSCQVNKPACSTLIGRGMSKLGSHW